MDYDFVVEEFKCEVKLDKDAIIDVVRRYKEYGSIELYKEFKLLWPEYSGEDIENIKLEDIPNTILKTTYYLQSRKDEKTLLPIDHHALNEIILFDAQSERDKYKRKASEAYKSHDMNNFKRFNAMQLGLKVISNSFYGASGNKTFAHFDPEVAGTITWAARQCIGLLTECLLTTELFVDEEFMEINENRERFEKLNSLGFVHCNIITKDDMKLIRRRNSLRRLFDEYYNLRTDKTIYKITKPVCKVVYQDTDSNYFECTSVQKHYLGIDPHDKSVTNFYCSPEILSNMMKTMVCLDLFICSIVDLIIGRKPVGLGFEGSFVVCRYMNRKKKYYGVKAADDDGNVFPFIIGNKLAYEENHLSLDYDKYWKPGKHLNPLTNGEYIIINNEILTNKSINYLDYVQSMNVKVTGVELTRRDPYKFINYYHLKTLQRDLRICRYNYNENKWIGINLNESLTDIINTNLYDFKDMIYKFEKIANLESDELPDPYFKLEHFTKNQRYQPDDSKNNVYAICERYKQEGKTQYIPEIGERLFYVVVANKETQTAIKKGIKSGIVIKKLTKGLNEYLDEIKSNNTEEKFKSNVGQLNLTYDDWINAIGINGLYHKHYLTSLASSMSLYLFGEMFPNEAARIDRGEVDESEEGKIVSKYQKQIRDKLVEMFYPSRKIKEVKVMKVKKITKTEISKKSELIDSLICEIFGDSEEFKNKELLSETLEIQKNNISELFTDYSDVYQIFMHDKLHPIFSNSRQNRIYNQFKNRKNIEQAFSAKIKILSETLYKINKLHQLLNN